MPDLVSSMSRLTHNAGLMLYLTTYKIHWMANFATFCFLITLVLQTVGLFSAAGDPEKLFECYSVLSFCAMGFLKLISLRNNQKIWSNLLISIQNLENRELNGKFTSEAEYESDDDNRADFPYFVSKYTNRFKTTSNVLIKIYSFTAIIFILSPFVERGICGLRDAECAGYPHILPGVAPFDSLIFGYLLTVLFEFVAAVYCVCVHVAFDLIAIGVMIFVCGQWALLRDYSSKIGGSGRELCFSKRRDLRAYYRIKHCHRTHLTLINLSTILDQLLRNIIGVYFFLATLTLCSVAVQLTTVNKGVMHLVSLLQFMGATLTQLFLYSLYGNDVYNESCIGQGQGPFGAAHWCVSPRVRRLATILGAGMISPRQLHAGPFNNLNLPSFIQVIRAAYSYYAVLAQKD